MSGRTRDPRHIFVTGAASGIGAAVCRRFARDGARLSMVDLKTDMLERLSDTLVDAPGAPGLSIVGDLADAEFAGRVLPASWERAGPVDVAVLAAGIYPAISLTEMTAEAWDRVQAVNVRAILLIIRALAERAVAERRPAAVVVISSGAAQRARPGAAAYSASKAALEMLVRSAALEFGPAGIRVNAVSPGFIKVASRVNPVTEDYAAAMSANPLGRPGRAEDIANAVHWLAGEEAEWVSGTVLRVDGGASAGAGNLPLHWPTPTDEQIPAQPRERDNA